MKRGGCTFGDGKTRGCPLPKGGGAVVSKSVHKLKKSVPPTPKGVFLFHIISFAFSPHIFH